MLRLIAADTRTERLRCAIIESRLQIMAGCISATLPDAVVLETGSQKTYVPRGLAESANRSKIGGLLALVIEQLDSTRVSFEVLPAIATENARDTRASPFGRSAPIHHLTSEDARLGLSVANGERASDVLMSAVMVDIAARVPPRFARVLAVVHAANLRSLRVCQRYGFSDELSRVDELSEHRRLLRAHR